MQSRSRLPHDVLLVISSYCDRRTLSALILTCRDLHAGCAKYVLAGPVVLTGSSQVVSFIYFMRAQRSRRWRHLRSLTLAHEPISPSIAAELARVIPRASHLETLEFESAESLLGVHPDLPLAFAAVKSIKHIVIHEAYQHTCRMLEAMHWPLETATLIKTVYRPGWFESTKLARMHPASLLRNSRSTLKSLVYRSWTERNELLLTYPVFPELRSLIIDGTWCPVPAQWGVTYPNLQDLSVHTIDSHFMETNEFDDILAHVATRQSNLDGFNGQSYWTHLESFEGDILDLYLLGLPCRIRSVSVTASSLQFFSRAMHNAYPDKISISLTSDMTEVGESGLLDCLRDPCLANLRCLNLSIDLMLPSYTVRFEQQMDQIVRGLQTMNVKELSLKLYAHKASSYNIRGPDFDCDTSPPPSPRKLQHPCPVEIWIRHIQPETFSKQVLERVPSLESVALYIRSAFWFEHEPKETRMRREKTDDGIQHSVLPPIEW
ncbi:hypothetical protein C8Q80DRAFT_1109758 [Daedaleopsis nitida]|nr:hypothetical protein C8Q80DRAFT_1109758 [Daedaleopsis nitida]